MGLMSSKREQLKVEDALQRIYLAIKALSPAYNNLVALAILSPERRHIYGFLKNYNEYPNEKLERLGLSISEKIIIENGFIRNILIFLAEMFEYLDKDEIKELFNEALEAYGQRMDDLEKKFGELIEDAIKRWADQVEKLGIRIKKSEIKQYLEAIVNALKGDQGRCKSEYDPRCKFYTSAEVPPPEEIFKDLKSTDNKAFKVAEDLYYFLREIGVIREIDGKDRLLYAVLKYYKGASGD